ncbi:hypothetical protein KC349_g5168 [Hortaea werneckii]|nr:hypothetical protein KC349_g5168 [Hortaea werneckii]
MNPHQHQQQQQCHEDLLVSLNFDCWLEDDEQYDHEPVTVACASRHIMQYLSPRLAWTSDPYHHLPPPSPPFGVWEKERVLFGGGLCGILTTSLIYPIDVAKTLYQKTLLGAGSGHATRPPISFFHFITNLFLYGRYGQNRIGGGRGVPQWRSSQASSRGTPSGKVAGGQDWDERDPVGPSV